MFRVYSIRSLFRTLSSSQAFDNLNTPKNISKINRLANEYCLREFSSSKSDIQPENLDKVQFTEFKKLLSNDSVVIIDVREPEELVEHGALPRALNIPLGELEAALKDLSSEQFLQKYGQAKPDVNSPIVFSCMRGMRSEKAQIAALQLDYRNVKNYVGGWIEWAEKNPK